MWMKVVGLLFFTVSIHAHNAEDFLHSFITNYGCSTNARDTRDYHPSILERTQKSFSDLESHIRAAGFTIAHRMVICGYQQEAVPSYFTHGADGVIDDEVCTQTGAGWHFADGNLFGFATGFLLKDVNRVVQSKGLLFEHIIPERVGLFDDRAVIFQKHAFGDAFALLAGTYTSLYPHIVSGNYHAVLATLHTVWRHLCEHQIRDGAHNLIATQDSLFSLYYAQYLLNSSTPITKFLVGPDITYPIELLSCQTERATQGAQACIKRMIELLQPVAHKKTAYIFCSFVDGVGKSTLLGNIKNFVRYADQYDHYERVDNSSSQRAELFEISDQVVIVDLPAQISHYLPKPDGSVFVDAATVKMCTPELINAVRSYWDANKHDLIANHMQSMQELQKDSVAWVSTDTPLEWYRKNCCICAGGMTDWIPFVYHDDYFLCNHKSGKLRMLVPISKAHSMGLKIVEPEQMIFDRGIAVPLNSAYFLTQVTQQMSDAGVEQVVFVDFMSMYPRSSRENIRVNFLLQQLKYHFGDLFCKEDSFYRHFVNPYDLYMLYKQRAGSLMNGIMLEAAARCALDILITQAKENRVTMLSADNIHRSIRDQIVHIYMQHKNLINDLVMKKIMAEYQTLANQCALDKDCEVYVQFDFELLQRFSVMLYNLFSNKVNNIYFNSLWSGMESAIASISGNSAVLENGVLVDVLGVYDQTCRDKIQLHSVCSLIRAYWYATLTNILSWQMNTAGLFQTESVFVAVPPVMVKPWGEHTIVLVRKALEPMALKGQELPELFFHQAQKKERAWGIFFGTELCLDWTGIATGQGVYAWGYQPHEAGGNQVSSVVRQFLDFYRKQGRKQIFVPTSVVCAQLSSGDHQQNLGAKKEADLPAVRLFIQAVATLDMIIKDPQADIMVRRDNRHDFGAAVYMTEHITLPHYFHIRFNHPLFDSYQEVKPLV